MKVGGTDDRYPIAEGSHTKMEPNQKAAKQEAVSEQFRLLLETETLLSRKKKRGRYIRGRPPGH